MIPPARFIPLAEETGLIVPIGDWVLREACAQAQTWCRQGLEGLYVAVNLSARQFSQPNLVERVVEALQASALSPSLLELELTESCVMEDPIAAARQLEDIADLGVRIAIDDFGTGYSSLGHLSRFSIHVLKIDQSFVQGITNNPYDAALVSAINAMAHSLGMTSVAEGVETSAQLALLKGCGCDRVQGYLLARPAPPESLDLRRQYL
jgi:EAL domain-containing protein (putative c-di-GMP-specific phosphodiesterase class I)